MKTKILHFIDTLSLYDYILFGGILTLFLILLVLAVLFHHKFKLAIAFVVMAFLLLTLAPFVGYMVLHNYLYAHTVTVSTVQDLQYSDILLLRGDIKNTSNQTLKQCTLTFGISKVSSVSLLNDHFYPYLPFRTQKITLTKEIKPDASESFKVLVEPFNYPKKVSVRVWSQCR